MREQSYVQEHERYADRRGCVWAGGVMKGGGGFGLLHPVRPIGEKKPNL